MKIKAKFDNESEGIESLFDKVSASGDAVSPEGFASLLYQIAKASAYGTSQVVAEMVKIECEFDATDFVRAIPDRLVEDLYTWKQEDKKPTSAPSPAKPQ